MIKNNIGRNERLMLKGSLKKQGFDSWRLVTNAISVLDGSTRTFFFEFYFLNPSVSSDEPILGFKNRFEKSLEDLQYALAGTKSAQDASSQDFVIPSFFMVRAGCFGLGGKQISNYFPCSNVKFSKNDFVINVKNQENSECVLSGDYCLGSLSVSKEELDNHPEYLCSVGNISWNLQFEKLIPFKFSSCDKNFHWSLISGKCNCEGKIVFDGEEFLVEPLKSFAYLDKNWGKDFVDSFLHLSSCDLTSVITGQVLKSSCFAVQGEFNKKLSVFVSIEGKNIEFHAEKSKKYKLNFDCTEMSPEKDGSVKLHWAVSAQNKKNVVDIDVFCQTDKLFLRDYESPVGERKLLKVVGGIASGGLRVYKIRKKTLELIEDISLSYCLAECGNIELPEK